MGSLFFWMLCGARPSGGSTFMIRQNHVRGDTNKKRRDLILALVAIRRRHRDDCHGWFAIKEAGEQHEIVVVS